jgi:hypothetical protein
MMVQPPVDPEKARAAHEEALRKTAEFQKKRAEEEGADATNSVSQAMAPVAVECKTVHPDPSQSLQFLDLSLTNNLPKAVKRLTMHLIYCDANGATLKEWTTHRELDRDLGGNATMELSQPAYFMPLYSRRVKVQVEDVRFADGTAWAVKPVQK